MGLAPMRNDLGGLGGVRRVRVRRGKTGQGMAGKFRLVGDWCVQEGSGTAGGAGSGVASRGALGQGQARQDLAGEVCWVQEWLRMVRRVWIRFVLAGMACS